MGVSNFLSMMKQTVTIAPFSSMDQYGAATYGSAVSYSARVVGKIQMVRTGDDQEKRSTKTVYLASNANIDEKDKITLPSGEVPQTPPILAVGRYPDEIQNHHTVVFL